MIVSTTEKIGRDFEIIGMVKGSSVRARWIGGDIMAIIRSIFGGEIKEYMELLNDVRKKAEEKMLEDAKQKGADAVIAVRFQNASIGQGMSEILIYGTAVKFK